MTRTRALVCSLLLAIPFVVQAQQSDGAESAPKRPLAPIMQPCNFFFEVLSYHDLPDLGRLGIEPIRIFGSQDFWRKGASTDVVPGEGDVMRGLARRPPNGNPIVLDVEHWPQRGTDEAVSGTVQRLRDVLARVRKIEPSANVGFYALPPIRDYWRAIRGQGHANYIEWQRENDKLRPVADASTMLFPSLYTFYDDQDGWARYAIANISEAKRLASGKRVYVFLWPQYHESNKTLALQHLSGEYWRRQLELVYEHADGVVLWGGRDARSADGRAAWNESAPWWIETKRFIETHDVRSCRRTR